MKHLMTTLKNKVDDLHKSTKEVQLDHAVPYTLLSIILVAMDDLYFQRRYSFSSVLLCVRESITWLQMTPSKVHPSHLRSLVWPKFGLQMLTTSHFHGSSRSITHSHLLSSYLLLSAYSLLSAHFLAHAFNNQHLW